MAVKKRSVLLAGWLTGWSAVAVAQATLAIELPPQPLSKALLALGRESGTNIVAPSGLVAEGMAPAVKGKMSSLRRRRSAQSGTRAHCPVKPECPSGHGRLQL